MHKVSIIIPIYNVEQYLVKCLDSVVNQTYKNLEIICVNDCSPDNSAKILEKYALKDNRIRVLNRENNGGLSAARNSGLDIATGEYIYFIDSDDWIDLDYIKKMVQAIETSNAEIVINMKVVTEKENISALYVHPTHEIDYAGNFLNYTEAIQNLMVNAWNRIIKRNFIEKYKLRFPENYIYEDLYFHYISLVNTDKIYVINSSCYHYLSRDTGISKNDPNKDIGNIKIFDKIYDYYKENNLLEKGVKIFSVLPYFSINSQEKYNIFKNYFVKIEEYLFSHKALYNELDLFFAKNILSSKSYQDYISYYPQNVVISYLRRKK